MDFRRHAAWIFVCLAYLFASPYFERLNNPNENARVWATRAIVEHGVQNIDQVQRDWGYVNDKARNEHHVYSGKAPGTSFLGVPVLWVQTKLRHLVGWPSPDKKHTTFWLRLFAVKLPLCLFLFAFARYVERATESTGARDLLVVALGLGTMFYPYGGMFVGHALAGAAAFGAFMLLDDPRNEPHDGPRWAAWARLAAAGLLAGATVLFEYQALLVSVVLAIYAAVRYRARWLAFAAGVIPPAFALGAYHTVLFGRPWRFPFGNVENPLYAKTAHAAGFHGLSLPHWEAFPNFLFSPSYGLFMFSPVLLLGWIGAIRLVIRNPRDLRREGVLVVAICVVMFVFLAGMSNWRGGWCVGPRYIAAIVPFLTLPIIKMWPELGDKRWAVALLSGLTLSSVVLNVVSGALYPHYPEQFDNPVFDLAFPLLDAGYVPYGLGWLLGLPGSWAMLPVGVAVIGALSLALTGFDFDFKRWVAQLAASVLIGATLLILLSAYGRKPRPAETQATKSVRELWEPSRWEGKGGGPPPSPSHTLPR